MNTPPPIELGKTFCAAAHEADWPRATHHLAPFVTVAIEQSVEDEAFQEAFVIYLNSAPVECQAEISQALADCPPTPEWKSSTLSALISAHLRAADECLERHDFDGLVLRWKRLVTIPPSAGDVRRTRTLAKKVCRYVGDIEDASLAAVHAKQSATPAEPAPNRADVAAVMGPMYRAMWDAVWIMAAACWDSGHHPELAGEILLIGFRACGWPTWRSYVSLMGSYRELVLGIEPMMRRRHRPTGGAWRHYAWIISGRKFAELAPVFGEPTEEDIPF